MDAEKRIFELLLVGEEQHKSIKDVLDALTVEREQLAQERKFLTDASKVMALLVRDVQKASQEVVPELKNALGDTLASSMTQSLAEVSEIALRAVSVASGPILENMTAISKQSEEASQILGHVVETFHRRWMWFCGGIAFLGILSVLASGFLVSWWHQREITQLQEQRQLLTQDIQALEQNVAVLEKKGGRIRMESCGPNSRLCVEVASNQGNGIKGYRGPWGYGNNGRSFVIPKGY
jgi:hypothetical protein